MRDVLRSSVNTWDTDHMGHMNVRRYADRASDGLLVLLLQLGCVPRCPTDGRIVRPRDQHMRFIRELRSGQGFTIRAGVASDAPALVAYEEMRTVHDEVAATIVTELSLFEPGSGASAPWPAALRDAAQSVRCEVPQYAAVRGVTAHPSRRRPSREHAVTLGMLPGFLGPVLAEDCDAGGVMHEATCMARIADGIPHFFGHLRGRRERPPGLGGAALEYRFVFHTWPRANDVIEVMSGLSAVSAKTMQVTHYVFDVASGECVTGAQAVVAWFDLTTRKAVAAPDDVREYLLTRVIDGLSL